MAEALGIAQRTYASYERDERIPDAEVLARLVDAGWNVNWLLTGEGPERLPEFADPDTAAGRASAPPQPGLVGVRVESLRLALQLADEALAGRTLDSAHKAELVSLIYELLEEGLPEAKVLRFAHAASGR